MVILKYSKWYVVLKNGFVDYTQEKIYATEFNEHQANEINKRVKGEIRL